MISNLFQYYVQANKTRDHESEAEGDSEGGKSSREEESKGSLEVTEEVRLFLFSPNGMMSSREAKETKRKTETIRGGRIWTAPKRQKSKTQGEKETTHSNLFQHCV